MSLPVKRSIEVKCHFRSKVKRGQRALPAPHIYSREWSPAFNDAIDAFNDAIDAFNDAIDAINAINDAIDAINDAIDAINDAIDAINNAIRKCRLTSIDL